MTWDNLLSGLIGAIIVLLLDRLIVLWKNKRDAKKLCSIFVNDLLAIIRMGEIENSDIADSIQRSLLSSNLWRNLTPEMIRTLPMWLLQRIVYIYTSFELYAKSVIVRDDERYIKSKMEAEILVKQLCKYAGMYDK